MKEITTEVKNAILAVTGTDRSDVLNKVAEILNAQIGDHQVYVGSSKNVEWDGLVIDISTKKVKGIQKVKLFYAWEKGDRKTIKMYV